MVKEIVMAAAFEFVGTLLIGIAVLVTHLRVGREHRIDKKVLREIRYERWISIVGMILITIGFIIHIRALT